MGVSSPLPQSLELSPSSGPVMANLYLPFEAIKAESQRSGGRLMVDVSPPRVSTVRSAFGMRQRAFH